MVGKWAVEKRGLSPGEMRKRRLDEIDDMIAEHQNPPLPLFKILSFIMEKYGSTRGTAKDYVFSLVMFGKVEILNDDCKTVIWKYTHTEV